MKRLPHLVYLIEKTFLLLSVVANLSWSEDSNFFIVVNNSTSNDSPFSLTNYSTISEDVCECNVIPGSETYLRFEDESSRIEQCMEDEISFLDVCNKAFQEYNYSFSISTTNDSRGESYEDKAAVCQAMETARTWLFKFEVILDQTLVCVYTKSCENKTYCLVSS